MDLSKNNTLAPLRDVVYASPKDRSRVLEEEKRREDTKEDEKAHRELRAVGVAERERDTKQTPCKDTGDRERYHE